MAAATQAEAIARNSDKLKANDHPVLQSQGCTFDSKDLRYLDGLGMAFSARGVPRGLSIAQINEKERRSLFGRA
jgi:hypothetical protein